ncbi:MAG: hypothetical protein [Arizlama microvirus]|nr:MAG: hypothetical protein [Arizlama microvirus]
MAYLGSGYPAPNAPKKKPPPGLPPDRRRGAPDRRPGVQRPRRGPAYRPGYVGPARDRPVIAPGNRPKLPAKFPLRIRLPWLDIIEYGSMYLFPTPRDEFSFTITESGWCENGSCPSVGPPYIYGPLFSQNRIAAGGCGGELLCIADQACPEATWTPGEAMGRTLANQPLNSIAMFEFKVIPGGATRCNILQRWTGPPSVAGGASNNPAYAYTRPGVRVPMPYSVPDPYADNPPGMPEPAPVPIPWRRLPYLPDPDPAILPGPNVRQTPAPQAWPDVVWEWLPVPGAAPQRTPFPRPRPQVVPRPGDAPGVVWPWSPIAPRPVNTPPYVSPGPAVGVVVTPRGMRDMNPRQSHARVRAKKNEREKKFRMTGVAAALWNLIGEATEAFDLVDILYNAIPCQVKFDAGMIKPGKLDTVSKAKFVADNLDKLDATELLRGKVKNDFEDWWYGLTSPERQYYGLQYRDGINTHGGKSPFGGRGKAEEDALRRERGQLPDDPVIGTFNQWVDDIVGKKPRGFSCCAGKKVTCGRPQRRVK